MQMFFVSYFRDVFRRWAEFRAASEQQVRDSIAHNYPAWEVIDITAM